MTRTSQARLLEVVAGAQSQGFVGPGDPAEHLSHSMGFADAAVARLGGPPSRFADLGTGGGVPGLVLATLWIDAGAVFIESSRRRSAALGEWVLELGLRDRVRVLEGRAETWAHAAGIRESFELVTARSFGRPAVTAEIGSGFVRVGGLLLVSEPPVPAADRWPPAALEQLGFAPGIPLESRGAHYVGIGKARALAADLPRPVGRPAKRPLW